MLLLTLAGKGQVVWYGTSIQQGGVASRAGNLYDAIIGRRLSRRALALQRVMWGVLGSRDRTRILGKEGVLPNPHNPPL